MRFKSVWSQRGQGLVEFAVIFPLFVFFLFALIDGGLLMGRYNNVNNAAKEGARLGAVGADDALIWARVRAQVHGLLDTASTDCGDWGSGAKVICVEWVSGPNGEVPGQPGASVRVRVKYRYEFLTPIVNWIGPGNWDVTACAIQRQEQSISPPNPQPAKESCDD